MIISQVHSFSLDEIVRSTETRSCQCEIEGIGQIIVGDMRWI